jgi:hypothetical protein
MKRNNTTKALLAGAAIAGMISGGLVSKVTAADAEKTPAAADAGKKDEKKGESHSCAGKNSCKGKGGCKSGDNGCKGKNSCKGKGGCAVKDGKPAH